MTGSDGFVGEEAGSGRASPVLDLVASAFLIALSAWVMVESIRLDVPDSLTTAPGLLPFLTAASMGVMAMVLAAGAWRRYRAGETGEVDEEGGDHWRTAGLAVIIAIYLTALEYLGFEYQFDFAGMWLTIGSFELVSTIIVTAILAIFWRAELWKCSAVALIWIFLLAGAFRYIFNIPLPG